MSNEHLKDKYSKTFKVVENVVNEWDPVDLLAIDCPNDEYDFEIQRIVSATLSVNNAEELAKKINDILYKAFEENFKKSKDCLRIADKIFKKITT
ncbi:DUF1871 family protein [Bacillus sp. FJAT-52991]|uniref:DUF1871 family protein n=1 Tax=Bacillus kandeliae TaxID=3129297 RepID=A0ABZ2N7U3_9BACI